MTSLSQLRILAGTIQARSTDQDIKSLANAVFERCNKLEEVNEFANKALTKVEHQK